MEFKNKREFEDFLRSRKLVYLAKGMQGRSFVDKNAKKVYKIFHEYYYDESSFYSKEDILKFSGIKNKTFLWPNDIITIDDETVGYTAPYKRANNLYRLDPLLINLDQLEKAIIKAQRDIKLLSDKGVSIFDIMYNILYARGNLYVVDTIEYGTYDANYQRNLEGFNLEIMYFLVSGYFDDFVKKDRELNNMYQSLDFDLLEFLKTFRTRLSQQVGDEVKTLSQARKLVRVNESKRYIRYIK